MASKVLKELEELRSMLAQPTPTLLGSPAAPALHFTPALPAPRQPHPGSSNSGNLRALEAAEEEMDAAMARQADILNSQLRARAVDLSEAQRTAAAAHAELANVRSQLAAAKQAAAAEAAAAEAQLAAREAELSALQAEVLALRAEADDLRHRLADEHAAVSRADDALSAHTLDLSKRLAAAAEQAQAAASAASWEQQQKECVLTQLADSQAQLAAAHKELAATADELRHTRQEAALQAESRRKLESALKRTATAAAALKEAKDLEISELRQRLSAERAVRKKCEQWLQSELNSREEMEALLVAVKDVTGSNSSGSDGSRDSGGDMAATAADIELLLARLCDEQPEQQQHQQPRQLASQGQLKQRQAGSVSRLIAGEAAADKARREFVQMKAALSAGGRVRGELAAAKKMLRQRLSQGCELPSGSDRRSSQQQQQQREQP